MPKPAAPELGTVFADWLTAEIRIIGVGRLGFCVRSPTSEWITLREVQTEQEVRSLCQALGWPYTRPLTDDMKELDACRQQMERQWKG